MPPTLPPFGDPSDPHPMPEHGDFVRPSGGNVHIVQVFDATPGGGYATMVCGKTWGVYALRPANGDHGRQCAACWDAI